MRKNNEVCSDFLMAARISQESFEKRQKEECPDSASANKCNLNHVGIFSTKWANL